MFSFVPVWRDQLGVRRSDALEDQLVEVGGTYVARAIGQ